MMNCVFSAICVERKGKEHIVKDDVGGFAILDVI